MAVSVIPRPVLTGMQLGQQTGNLLLGEQAAKDRTLVNAMKDVEQSRLAGLAVLGQTELGQTYANAFNRRANLSREPFMAGVGGYTDAQGNKTIGVSPYELPQEDPYFRARTTLANEMYKYGETPNAYKGTVMERYAPVAGVKKMPRLVPTGEIGSDGKPMMRWTTEEELTKNRQQYKLKSQLHEDIINYLKNLAGQ